MFYFSGHYQLNQNLIAFSRAKRINIAEHSRHDGLKNIYMLECDMFPQIPMGNVIINAQTACYSFT
jgi:succinoglycan biosynthesis protein ExoW